jgi:hypothetical protein
MARTCPQRITSALRTEAPAAPRRTYRPAFLTRSAGTDLELPGHEAQRRLRDGLARTEQPAGVAEGAELERVAEAVVRAPAPVDSGEVGPVQRPVPDEVGFGDR